jgi:hypothetical protein
MNAKLTSSVFGNSRFIFDPILMRLQKDDNMGNWIGVASPVITYPTDLTLVKGYNLRDSYFVYSLLTDSAAKEGELYVVRMTVFPKISWTSATGVAYRDFTDEVSNFLRWGDDNTLWLTIN